MTEHNQSVDEKAVRKLNKRDVEQLLNLKIIQFHRQLPGSEQSEAAIKYLENFAIRLISGAKCKLGRS